METDEGCKPRQHVQEKETPHKPATPLQVLQTCMGGALRRVAQWRDTQVDQRWLTRKYLAEPERKIKSNESHMIVQSRTFPLLFETPVSQPSSIYHCVSAKSAPCKFGALPLAWLVYAAPPPPPFSCVFSVCVGSVLHRFYVCSAFVYKDMFLCLIDAFTFTFRPHCCMTSIVQRVLFLAEIITKEMLLKSMTVTEDWAYGTVGVECRHLWPLKYNLCILDAKDWLIPHFFWHAEFSPTLCLPHAASQLCFECWARWSVTSN